MILNEELKKRIEYWNVAGVSVTLIEEGRIKGKEAYGVVEAGTNHEVAADTVFNACSISKLPAAILAMLLVDKGILQLDEDINHDLKSWSVPESPHTNKQKVTLRHLLSHRSGISDPKHSFSEYTSNNGVPAMLDLLHGQSPYCQEAVQFAHVPGTQFDYSDAGYCLIQLLIEEAAGKKFEVLAEEMIFRPLNMKNSRYVSRFEDIDSSSYACGHKKDGSVISGKYSIYPYPAAAGLWSTGADLASLVIEHMSSLQGQGKLKISKAIMNEMITPQEHAPWAGLGLFLEGTETERNVVSQGWGLGYQCMLKANPYTGDGIVVLTNSDLGVHQNDGIIGEIMRSC